jgi:hypothetical protein
MKNHVFAFGVSALLAGTAFVNAQTPQTPSTDPSASPSAQSSSMGQTVTGCLTPSADGKSFTLTEISASGAASSSASAPKTWTVASSGDVDLTKYANHKVEITASSDKSDPSASASSSSSSASTASATSGPKLNVKSVRDISNTCS